MYSCFINSTIAQANENNHSSKVAFLSLLLFILFVDELNLRLITCKCNIFSDCDFVELIFFVLLHGQKTALQGHAMQMTSFHFNDLLRESPLCMSGGLTLIKHVQQIPIGREVFRRA